MHIELYLVVATLMMGMACGQSLMDSIFHTSESTPIDNRPRVPTQTPRPINTRSGGSGNATLTCGSGKKCVREYLCLNGKVNEGGAAIIDLRIGDDTCPYLETCCAVDNEADVEEMINAIFSKPLSKCGYRNSDGTGMRITGAFDDESQFGEFPWMVAVLREESVLGSVFSIYQCGGSLINRQVVLTAAHCIDNKLANTFKVRAGEWETNTKNELLPHQDRKVLDIVFHEQYNDATMYNDVALLFLAEPFDLEAHINTICLPPPNFKLELSRCIVTGWGKNKFENGQYENILKKIELPIVRNDQCQTMLRTTRLSEYFKLHPSFICAGGEKNKDACKGDGGSPLVCLIDGSENRYHQVGIVSWGIGCGDENLPGVYVSVMKIREWIDRNLQPKLVDRESYIP